MNLSYNWLCELVKCGLSPEDMARKLTFAGCSVEDIVPVGEDHMLVAEVTTNRPDWLCHWGVARELAALTQTEADLPQWDLPEGEVEVESLTSVAVDAAALEFCPRYTARVIQGVRVGESPDWLKRRLEAIGQRPINNVVDITNYVMFETNEPLHAFDYDLLAGNRIRVRMARAGEEFSAITGEKGELSPEMLVIADADKAVALAGVKGGANSEVHAGTRNILLEAAWFKPDQVRRTSRATRMASESSYRFERGVDPGGVERASARAAYLLHELTGGTVARGVIDTGSDLGVAREVSMRFGQCEKLLGMRVEPVRIADIFRGLGLEVVFRDASRIHVRVPAFRQDLSREVDLIEEVVRVAGYDMVPTRVSLSLCCAAETELTSCSRVARETLVGLGYHECVTDAFVPEKWLDGYGEAESALRVRNPINARRPCLRTSLIPSLLEVRGVNRLEDDVRLFEAKHVYHGKDTEPVYLALLDDRGVEFVRGAFEAIADVLKVDAAVEVEPSDESGVLTRGTGAKVSVDGNVIGWYGVISSQQARLHDLVLQPAVLEIDLGMLAGLPRRKRVFSDLPRFPAVRRDIALVVPEKVLWNEVERLIWQQPDMIEAVKFQSVYRGKGLRQGEKSIAFAIIYRSCHGSLTDDEANALRDRVLECMINNIDGAKLRQQ